MGGCCPSSLIDNHQDILLYQPPPDSSFFEPSLQAWQDQAVHEGGVVALKLGWVELDEDRLRRLLRVLETLEEKQVSTLTSLTLQYCTSGTPGGADFARPEWRRLLLQVFKAVATTQQVDTIDLKGSADLVVTGDTLLSILRLWSTTNAREEDPSRNSSAVLGGGATNNNKGEARIPSQLSASTSSPFIHPLVSLDLSGHSWITNPEIWRTLQQEFPALQVLRFNDCNVPALDCFIQGALFPATTRNHEEVSEEMAPIPTATVHAPPPPDRDIIMPRPFWPALQHLNLEFAKFTRGRFRQLVVGLCSHPSSCHRQLPPPQLLDNQKKKIEEMLVSSPLVSSPHTDLLSGRRVLDWLQQQEKQPTTTTTPPPPIALRSLSFRGARDLGVTALSWLSVLLAHQPELQDLNVSFAPELFHSLMYTSPSELEQLEQEEEAQQQHGEQHYEPIYNHHPTATTTIPHHVPPLPRVEEDVGRQLNGPRIRRGRRVVRRVVREPTTNTESSRYPHLKQPFLECFAYAVAKHRTLKKLSLRSSLPDNDMATALFHHLEHHDDELDDRKPSLQTLNLSRNKNMGELALLQFIASLPRLSSLRTVDMCDVPCLHRLAASQRTDLVTALSCNQSLCDFQGAPRWLHEYPMPLAPLSLPGSGGALPGGEWNKDIGNSASNGDSAVPFLKTILSRNRALCHARQMLQSVDDTLTKLMALEEPVGGDRTESAAFVSYVTSAWPVWLEQLAHRSAKEENYDSLENSTSNSGGFPAVTAVDDDEEHNEGHQEGGHHPHGDHDEQQQQPPPTWVASSYYMVLRSQQWDWVPSSQR